MSALTGEADSLTLVSPARRHSPAERGITLSRANHRHTMACQLGTSATQQPPHFVGTKLRVV